MTPNAHQPRSRRTQKCPCAWSAFAVQRPSALQKRSCVPSSLRDRTPTQSRPRTRDMECGRADARRKPPSKLPLSNDSERTQATKPTHAQSAHVLGAHAPFNARPACESSSCVHSSLRTRPPKDSPPHLKDSYQSTTTPSAADSDDTRSLPHESASHDPHKLPPSENLRTLCTPHPG